MRSGRHAVRCLDSPNMGAQGKHAERSRGSALTPDIIQRRGVLESTASVPGSFSGRTGDFESSNLGSNPSPGTRFLIIPHAGGAPLPALRFPNRAFLRGPGGAMGLRSTPPGRSAHVSPGPRPSSPGEFGSRETLNRMARKGRSVGAAAFSLRSFPVRATRRLPQRA